MKKLLTLAVALVTAIGSIAAPQKVTRTDGTKVVFVNNKDDDGLKSVTPNIHYWGGSNGSTYPGPQMTKVADNLYYYQVQSSHNTVKFNNGSNTVQRLNSISSYKSWQIFCGSTCNTIMPSAMPTTIWVIGNIAGDSNWDNTKAVRMTREGNKFTAKEVSLIGQNGTSNSYFSFITDNGSSWSNKTRFGAATKDETVTIGAKHLLVPFVENYNASGCLAYKVTKAGSYNITLDLDNMTMTVVEAKEVPSVTSNFADGSTFTTESREITLTPSTNTSSWSYTLGGTTVNRTDKAPVKLTIGAGDKPGTAYNITWEAVSTDGTKASGKFSYKKVSEPVKVNASEANNFEFWDDTYTFTLTPTAGTVRWSYKIGSNPAIGTTGTTPASFELGKTGDTYDNYGTTYTVTWTATNASGDVNTGTFTFKKSLTLDNYVDGNNYYLYGDMNRWSCLGIEYRGKDQIKYHNDTNGQGRQLQAVYNGGLDQNNIHREEQYASRAEIIKNWRFEKCAAPAGQTGNNWYKFDLSKVSTLDGAHADGRLCGQFKIIQGNLYSDDGRSWGGVAGSKADNNYHADNTITTGTVYTAKHKAGQNLMLDANHINNAVLYLQPGNPSNNESSKILILGRKEDIYLYYWNQSSDIKPVQMSLGNASQYNYYFNRSSLTSGSDNFDLSKLERIDVTTLGIEVPEGCQPYAYRIKLPNSVEHRSPISFTAKIKGRKSEIENEVVCEDLWLIEGEARTIALDMSCNAEINAGPVYYNLERPVLQNGQPVGTEKLWSENAYMTYDATAQKWTGSKKVEGEWLSGSQIHFYDGYGREFTYPANGAGRFTYDCSADDDPQLHILYTHLNGTFDMDKNHGGLQIEAEYFLDDDFSTINTSYSDIQYDFKVYDEYGRDCSSQLSQEIKTAPYVQWNVKEAGWYNVRVTATDLSTGKSVSVVDRYPVFGSSHVSRPADFAPVSSKRRAADASGHTVYFRYGTQPYVYYWGITDSPSFGGTIPAMEKVEGDIYKYTFASAPEGVIFMKGSTASDGNKIVQVNKPKADKVYKADGNFLYNYNNIYIIGKGISGVNDWKEASGIEMTPENPYTLKASVTLSDKAEFRFKDNIKDWYGNYFPTTTTHTVGEKKDPRQAAVAGNTYNVDYTTGTTNNAWSVEKGGTYTVTLDLGNYKMTLTEGADVPGPDPEPEPNPYIPADLPDEADAEFLVPAIERQQGSKLTATTGIFPKDYTYSAMLTLPAGAKYDPMHTVTYSWAKFEDYTWEGSSYSDFAPAAVGSTELGTTTKDQLSDNYLIVNNTTTTHYCRNWHPAFYRVYATSSVDNGKRRVSHGAHGQVGYTRPARVARTVPMDTEGITGVENINGDNDAAVDAPVYYFDLNGRAVDARNLTPGFYIRRQGNTAAKVYVR